MRKFFSVLLCIILIISICFCASVPGSAVFIIDDALLTSIGISIAASVLLSIGISAVAGSDNQYVEFATACGQLVWEQMVQDYTQAEILAMITIENGKAYFRCPESLFTKLKNWANTYNWSNLTYMGSVTSNSSDLLPNSTSYRLDNYPGHFAKNSSSSPLSLSVFNSTAYFTTSSGCIISLNNDGTLLCHSDLNSFTSTSETALIGLCNDGNFRIGNVYDGYIRRSNGMKAFNIQTNYGSAYAVVNGDRTQLSISNNKVWVGSTAIADLTSSSTNQYQVNCIVAGRLLSNLDNNIVPINSNSSLTSYSVPVDTEVLSPAIPGNRVGSEQTVLVPIPSTFEDPSLPGVPLPQRTVKNRVKRGQDVALVPDLPSLQDKTPQDLGVLVVNNTDIQDTTISPTLDTSVYGENSTTFVIIPQVPINTPIPNDDNQPLVSSPYPDVINPGSETITVTANDDIFPTANNPPATTARPSVSVSNPDEVASSAAEDVVEGVSEIASQAVKDIAEPLSPSDIEKGANRMKLMPQLLHKFPFCIPFDFYNAINQFAAPSEVPKFDIPIRVQSLNFDYNVHVDLTNFETAAKISRWFFSVAWVVTLIFLTRKVIWK